MMGADFVYKEVYRRSLKAGVKDGVAANFANRAMELFAKGRFTGRASKLILDTVNDAKKYGAK